MVTPLPKKVYPMTAGGFSMSAGLEPDGPVGFADRMEAEAEAEATRVLAELARLKFDAHQVVHVMKALKMDVPYVLLAVAQMDERQVATPVIDLSKVLAGEPAKPDKPEPVRVAVTGREETMEKAVQALADGGSVPVETVRHRLGRVLTVLVAAGRDGFLLGKLVAEIAKGDSRGLSQAAVSRYLAVARDHGLVEKKGRAWRRTGPGDPAPVLIAPAALAQIRDYVCGQKKGFSPAEVSKATGQLESVVRRAFMYFVERGVIEYAGVDDVELYEYRAPRKPGKAAEMDSERAKSVSTREPSVPVAGTGKQVTASNKDVQALIKDATQAGARVTHAASGHFAVVNPNSGKRVLIASTPTGTRSVQNDRMRVRRIGLAV